MLKTISAMLVLSVISSAALADGVFTCENRSGLAVLIQQRDSVKMDITVTKSGAADIFMPKVGEKNLLSIDSESSKEGYYISRTSYSDNVRSFEFSVRKEAFKTTKFAATLGISEIDSDLQFASYDMTCIRH